MNNRDPFNLRRTTPVSNIFQTGAAGSLGGYNVSQVSQRAKAASGEAQENGERVDWESTKPVMAFAPGVPTQRHPDLWQSSRANDINGSANGAGASVSEKISGMFAGRRDSLPMYKDKPSGHYPGGRRQISWLKRRRNVVLLLAGLAGLSWWFGILSPLYYFSSDNQQSKSKPSSWSMLGSSAASWDERAERVKDAFKLSFADYEKHGWGDDEYHPISKTGRKMTPSGMGWIIVDSLDTMMLMNLTTELEHARQWVHNDLTYDQDHDVSTFETTIRMLGGLLAAHYLSTNFKGRYAPVNDGLSDDLYVEKATDLADRLLGAFGTQSGVPLASVNLHTMQGIPSHADAGASSTAEATSVQLEMKYLAKLTGEEHYWHKAEHVMKVVDDNNMQDGLLPIFIYADRGDFRGNNIRLGSRGDSYYEYLVKQYMQTSQQEPVYQAMWNESLAGIKKHLLTYSYPSNFTVLAERPSGLQRALSPKMDHLVCFLPGSIALATTGGLPVEQARRQPNWGPNQEEDMKLAEELMKTCWGMYTVTPTGLAGEITYFNIHDPPLMYEEFSADNRPQSPKSFGQPPDPSGPNSNPVGSEDYMIKAADSHNLQRPETVESLFYMWRITGDEKYRQWGWQMFESFIKHTVTPDGLSYSSVGNVLAVPPPSKDNLESFWLAETLKYFYLLFSSNDILPLTEVVFNTEAHVFPKFQLGKLFSTGWERRARDANGNILPEKKQEDKKADSEVKVQTVQVLETKAVATSTLEASTDALAASDAAETALSTAEIANLGAG